MKAFLISILCLVSLFLGYQVYTLYAERKVVRAEASQVQQKLTTLEDDQAKLKDDVGYFSDIRNLAKELKSLFNYKRPGEHMMIIVPKKDQ